jgi:methanogenic corrinoid protein MtbC1
LREAAELSGLHYMTLYRHVRTGRLAASQSQGKWWLEPGALAALGRRQRPGRRPGPVRWQRLGSALEERMLAGDVAGAWAIVETALGRGASAAEVYLKGLAPALRAIGDGWATGRITVHAEHTATEVAIRVMGRLGPQFHPRGSRRLGTVVVGGAPGDPHLVPVAMLADLLRLSHFSVLDLGANVPEESFAEISASSPHLRAVGVSLSDANCASAAASCLAAVRAAAPSALLLLGGPAVATRQDALSLGADDWAADGLGAAQVLGQKVP